MDYHYKHKSSDSPFCRMRSSSLPGFKRSKLRLWYEGKYFALFLFIVDHSVQKCLYKIIELNIRKKIDSVKKIICNYQFYTEIIQIGFMFQQIQKKIPADYQIQRICVPLKSRCQGQRLSITWLVAVPDSNISSFLYKRCASALLLQLNFQKLRLTLTNIPRASRSKFPCIVTLSLMATRLHPTSRPR